MTESKCRSCGAAIAWLKTKAGKTLPVDFVSVDDGNLMICGETVLYLSGAEMDEAKRSNTPLHKSHFATCPNADKHRKK